MRHLEIFIVGIWVLVVAVIANFLAMRFGINTWYGFINDIGNFNLVTAITQQTPLDMIFLFLIYPVILGLPGWSYFKAFKSKK